MTTVLYRRYRPKTFAEITNQNHIKITLQHELEMNRISHAYLFSGPRGVGKTTTARIFSRAANCLNRKEGQGEPCNQCAACEDILLGRSLDVIEIDAATHTQVDHVRDHIISGARLAPSRWQYKIFIIDEVHMLSLSAFNALLKILEEPPEHVIFILATTEAHKVPPTVISRCQHFDFKKIIYKELVERLRSLVQREEREMPEKVLEDIARHADGSVRDAESLLGQIFALGGKKISEEQARLVIPATNLPLIQDFVGCLLQKNVPRSLDLINQLVENGADLQAFLDDLIEFLRRVFLMKVAGAGIGMMMELEEITEKKMSYFSQQFGVQTLLKLLNSLTDCRQSLKRAVIVQLPLEMVIVEFCSEGQEYPNWSVEKKADVAEKAPTAGPEKQPDAQTTLLREESPEAKKVVTEESAAAASVNGISFSDIKKHWDEILEKMRDENPALYTILRSGTLMQLDKNILKLGFQFKFHQERAQERKNLIILEKMLREILGSEIQVAPVVVSRTGAGDDDIKEALEQFGGRIVE